MDKQSTVTMGPADDKNVNSSVELLQTAELGGADFKESKYSLFKTQSIVATVLIVILLVGNAGLFIWSNISVAAIVWMDVDAGPLGGILGALGNLGGGGGGGAGGALGAIGGLLGGGNSGDSSTTTRSVDPFALPSNGMEFADDILAGSRVARESPTHQSMYSFSLVSSVNMMWESQTYWLAVLIVVASGAWPYIKILIMAITWFVPMKSAIRTRILRVIEFLGKWSLIDMYVLVIMTVAFPVLISVLGLKINILVEPVWGFYSFLIAALWNMLNNQIIAIFHYRTVRQDQGPVQYTPGNTPLGKAKGGNIVYIVGGVLAVVGAVLMIGGLVVNSYDVNTSGLAIKLNKDVEGDVLTRTFSAITTGTELPPATYSHWAVTATMVVFLFFTVGTPCLWALCTIVLWWLPMGGALKYRLANFNEFIFSWSAMDVYLMSIAAAVVELHKLAEGTMPDFCKTIAALPGGTTCYSIEAEFAAGFWVLLAGVVVMYAVYFMTLLRAKKATVA